MADPVVIESTSQHLQRVKLHSDSQPGVPIKASTATSRRGGPAPHGESRGRVAQAGWPGPVAAGGSVLGKGHLVHMGSLHAETAFSPGTTSALLQGDSNLDAPTDQAESKMRECFSEAFDKEVEYLASLNVPVTKERKRQILADILVWAEVTQQHYDTTTRSFVLEPNQHDESFLRVGRYLLDAKRQRSLL